jgi:hypothetical protein
MMSSRELAHPGKAGTPVSVDDLPTLQLDDIAQESEAALIARGAAYVREYTRIQGKATTLLKNVATVLVALRIRHGDMLGTSQAYRNDAAEVYLTAEQGGDVGADMRASVRYHVGNLLRRTMTTRELEQAGLQTTSPLERFQDRRAVDAAIVKAVKVSNDVAASTPKPAKGERVPEQGGQPVKATADHLRLAQVAGNILGQLDANVIDQHMTPGQRAKLDEQLAVAQKLITALRRHTRKPSSKA